MTDSSFEQAATQYYAMLYRFALSLAQDEASALDLVQQTFYRWAVKGHQLRDAAKIKTWLFTTLYREFLATRRQQERFPQVNLEVLDYEPAYATAGNVEGLDAGVVMQALSRVDEIFRAPLALFYLENLSYKQIAEMLEVPAGTVMSRLARGREQLRRLLTRAFDFEATPNPSRPAANPQSKP